jgi:hypothetical protein
MAFCSIMFARSSRPGIYNINRLFIYLAAFCGRYDLVLILLTKTDASPFVRDHIQLKSMFDYIENDMNYKECQIR